MVYSLQSEGSALAASCVLLLWAVKPVTWPSLPITAALFYLFFYNLGCPIYGFPGCCGAMWTGALSTAQDALHAAFQQ